jgi:hypothetical protein
MPADPAAALAWVLEQLPQSQGTSVSAKETSMDKPGLTNDVLFLVLVGLVIGAVAACVRYVQRRKPAGGGGNRPQDRGASAGAARLKVACYAFSVSAGVLRSRGEEPDAPSVLLTESLRWWVGAPEEWEALRERAGLAAWEEEAPAHESAPMVVVFEVSAPEGEELATSRYEGARRLRDAAKEGRLRRIGAFKVPNIADLAPAGFKL